MGSSCPMQTTGTCLPLRFEPAHTIVTFNLKDFPSGALEPLGIEAKHPDEFLLETIDLAPGAVAAAVMEQVRALKNPPRSLEDLLDTLAEQGLTRSIAKLRELFGAGM